MAEMGEHFKNDGLPVIVNPYGTMYNPASILHTLERLMDTKSDSSFYTLHPSLKTVFLTLGTGVGGGIVLSGHLWNGYNGAAGEFGHMLVNPNETELCSCGKRGCLEQYASATGLVRCMRLQLQTDDRPSRLRGKETFTAKDVIDAAKDGDALALTVAQSSFELLGVAAANLCNALNPEAVILGGGVSKAGQILLDHVAEPYKKYAFHACRDTKIGLATLGNDAGMYGAARMVLD